ncbi:MAG TPA: sulfate adenylyltransferase [Planctomycetota bacterium]|nr:sulfate adenylyltransferase [Planctomycetota bacterium]
MTTYVSPSAELVDLRLSDDAAAAARDRAAGLKRFDLDRNQVLDLEKIADGAFSPLVGFMGSTDLRAVVDDGRLADGRPWTIPVVLQTSKGRAESVKVGDELLLWNAEEDAPSGLLVVGEIYRIDLLDAARKVYGVEDRAHPGVARWLDGGDTAIAGPIRLLRRSASLVPKAFDLGPREVRAEFARRGWKTITGFQTRNLGHRAHERLQKMGLELTDGLLIHPLIGWKKKGDMLPEVILDGYRLLVDRYYPPRHVMLAGLTTAMRYAGPREAVFHALIRRNFGCTHFIVGRDHAGVGGYYEKYAAHRMVSRYTKEELGITPLLFHGPCWCETCGEIVTEKTCPHGDRAWVDISGTEVRAMIGRGERPPAFFMRPEIADFLVARAKSGAVFFDG